MTSQSAEVKSCKIPPKQKSSYWTSGGRREQIHRPPISINGDLVERVHSLKYLGIHIFDDLTWTVNTTTTAKKATQRLYFLRILKKNKLHKDLLLAFNVLPYSPYSLMASLCGAQGARQEKKGPSRGSSRQHKKS